MTAVEPSTVAQLVDYDPQTGLMLWKARGESFFSSSARQRAWNDRFAGKPAFAHLSQEGYLTGRLLCRMFKGHRIAWAIHHGCWPEGEIDHINGDRADNRIKNLRDVPKVLNGRNQKLHATNTSGVAGVSFKSDKRLWRARISIDGRMRTIGTYASFDRAVAARKAAEARLQYHENHGARA